MWVSARPSARIVTVCSSRITRVRRLVSRPAATATISSSSSNRAVMSIPAVWDVPPAVAVSEPPVIVTVPSVWNTNPTSGSDPRRSCGVSRSISASAFGGTRFVHDEQPVPHRVSPQNEYREAQGESPAAARTDMRGSGASEGTG